MAAGDRALSRVGRARRSREALAARLGDGHHDTREAAMHELAIRLDPRAVSVLLDFLDDYEGPMLDSAPGADSDQELRGMIST